VSVELITTVGGLTSNSYATLAEADAYFLLRPNATAWTDITDDDERSKLLLWAMRSLDGLGWIGGRITPTQPLDWPRIAIRPAERVAPHPAMYAGAYGLYDLRGQFHATTSIPQALKNAQCEQALASQQSTAWTTTEKYKRRIIQNKEGLIEFRTGGAIGGMSSLAASELSGLLITGAAMSLVSR
jgi:hypothetical protein